MYYYMLKASKPLKEEEDEFVNGYIIENEEINEDDDESWYKNKAKKEEEYDTFVDEYSQLLTSNNQAGYEARTKAAESFVTYGPDSSPIKNEAGWICEYYFGLNIVPSMYDDEPIEPSADKFLDRDTYFEPWDFTGSNWTADVKVQSITALGTNEAYDKREYYCQLYKFTKKLPSTNIIAIWWAEIDSFEAFVLNRTQPTKWKYFQVSQEEWANEYYIIKEEDVVISDFIEEGEEQILAGLYKKNEYYNPYTKKFEDVRIARMGQQAGQDKGPQLIFQEKYLTSFP